jgi:eukaryotic-like serine/threonine-protein kinase
MGEVSHAEPGEWTMGAADSFDLKIRAVVTSDGDGSSLTVGPSSPGREPADVTGKDVGRQVPDVSAVTHVAETLAPSDPVGFILQVDRPASAAGPSPCGDYARRAAERAEVAPSPPNPSSVLSRETLDGHVPPVPRERPVPVIDGYEILGELGRGGMGVVYRAREIRLNRLCALKMILGGVHADAEAALRFLAEAESVARLQHPNIVQIHHIGEADGLPFFELEYVDGGSLDRRLDGTPWPARRAAELVEALAGGIADAHRLGIVHRDLKPANVLLAPDGTPKITDFGLAKSVATDSGLTRTGSIMGSPDYMSSEQAEGKTRQVGPLADVYALGAILYELLTGGPPFRGTTALEILDQVKNAEPVPPSRLVPGLPRDAETIALKCLQKEPAKRYDSAAALAEDLRRFLGGEPIVARPVPLWERVIKWARRRPAIASLIVAVHVLLASLLGLGIWSYAEIDRSLTVARAEGKRALEQSKIAQAQTAVATKKAEDLAWEDYINRVNRAYREVQDDNVALAEDLLHGCPIGRRGWEWHYVKRLCHPERLSVDVPAGSVSAIAFSPDGNLIATGSAGHYARDMGDSNVEMWDRGTGRRVRPVHATKNVIWSLAFSPDGTRLALGGTNPQVEVRDTRTGEVLWAKHKPRLPQAMGVAFSPDGKSLAAGFGQYSNVGSFQVTLYQVATGSEMETFPGPKGGVNELAFRPDGRHLAVGGMDIIEIWDVAGHAKVRELGGHSKWVYGVAYSPDGRWLATGGWDRTIKLWDAATGEERLTIFGHEGFVLDLAFSPDGRTLASAGEDRSVRLWEVPSGRPIGVFHGHTGFALAIAFAPDGRELASGGLEGTMKVWGPRTSLPVTFEGHTGWVGRLWYRRDGRRVVSAAIGYQVPGETTKGWDPGTGELDPTLTGVEPGRLGDDYSPPSSFSSGAPPRPVTSPDGNWIARVGAVAGGVGMTDRGKEHANNSVQVLDATTGRVLNTLIGHTEAVVSIAFSPDGRRIATASFDRTGKLWDTATGREVFTLRGHTAGLLVLAFSPDGLRIVSGGIDFGARVWDATPLPTEVLLAQDARFQEKIRTLGDLTRQTEDTQRAEDLARDGRWDLSAAAYGRLVEQEPNSPGLRYPHIRSLAAAGDSTGVRRACEVLLKRFANATYHVQINSLVWSCVLTPEAVADHEALVRLVEPALASQPGVGRERSDFLNTFGAALYRAGRFEEAVLRLDEGIQAGGDGGDPRGFAFLALAHHRLGHRDEAKLWLGRLGAYQPKEGPDFSWTDVEIRILRREAESLVLAGRPADLSPTASEPNKKAAGGTHER